ncbi:MAG: MarR family transcriptional regulator [Gemmatimonadota bacterium]
MPFLVTLSQVVVVFGCVRHPSRFHRTMPGHTASMNPAPTARQGQFLAYIFQYSLVNGCAPAEADMQRFFRITPPSVHSMVLTLERRGFIQRVPGKARSIKLIVPFESLPPLKRVPR